MSKLQQLHISQIGILVHKACLKQSCWFGFRIRSKSELPWALITTKQTNQIYCLVLSLFRVRANGLEIHICSCSDKGWILPGCRHRSALLLYVVLTWGTTRQLTAMTPELLSLQAFQSQLTRLDQVTLAPATLPPMLPTAENLCICHNPTPKVCQTCRAVWIREKSVLGTNLQGRKQGRREGKVGQERRAGEEDRGVEPSFWKHVYTAAPSRWHSKQESCEFGEESGSEKQDRGNWRTDWQWAL